MEVDLLPNFEFFPSIVRTTNLLLQIKNRTIEYLKIVGLSVKHRVKILRHTLVIFYILDDWSSKYDRGF